MGRSFWEHWRTETCAFLVAMCSTVLILFLEPALWSDTWPAGIFDFRIPNALAASLLLVFPFNGWLLDRFLSSKTANETACPRWLLMLRGLFASVPLAGLYAISLWKLALAWTASRRVTRSLRLDLSRRCDRLAVGLHPRALYRSGFFFVWLASNFLPLLVWALWLGQTGALGSASAAGDRRGLYPSSTSSQPFPWAFMYGPSCRAPRFAAGEELSWPRLPSPGCWQFREWCSASAPFCWRICPGRA